MPKKYSDSFRPIVLVCSTCKKVADGGLFVLWSMWDLVLVSLRKQAALRAGKGRQMAAFLYVEHVGPYFNFLTECVILCH